MFKSFYSLLYDTYLISHFRSISLPTLIFCLFGIPILVIPNWVGAEEVAEASTTMQINSLLIEGENLRNKGDLITAQLKFDQALQVATSSAEISVSLLSKIEIASGYNLFLLSRIGLAKTQLEDAYHKTLNDDPYLHALVCEYLAYLAGSNTEEVKANMYLEEALKIAKLINYSPLEFHLELQRYTLSSEDADIKASMLLGLGERIAVFPNDLNKARIQLSLSQQILSLSPKLSNRDKLKELSQLAADSLTNVISIVAIPGQERFMAEAYATRIGLYRLQGKTEDALALLDKTVNLSNEINALELTAKLEADKGDLFSSLGDNQRALAAYEHAVTHLNKISTDIPISLPDGQTTIQKLTDPIHRKYVDLLFQASLGTDQQVRHNDIIKALENMEIIKQADLQDFFLGKCSISESKVLDWKSMVLPVGVAIVYPILLADRIELIVKINQEYFRYTVSLYSAQLINHHFG
jgi:tetratricopeptide (TPR) repeat protein